LTGIRCQRARPDPVTCISTTNHAANSLATTLLSRDWLDTNRVALSLFTFPDEIQLISRNIGTISAKVYA